jgi:hypothetical protein
MKLVLVGAGILALTAAGYWVGNTLFGPPIGEYLAFAMMALGLWFSPQT